MNALKIKRSCITTFPHGKSIDKILNTSSQNPDSEVIAGDSLKRTVKFGIDPTGKRLHLGHLVPLLLARELGEAKHPVQVVLGTFTARIGDPTGVEKTRPILSYDEVSWNAHLIEKQIETLFDYCPFIFVNNEEWLSELDMDDLIRLMSKFSVTRLMSRDNFQKRQKGGHSVRMHELLAPLLQGIDSYEVNSEIEIGGIDQLFNFDISREVQTIMHDDLNEFLGGGLKPLIPQDCLMTPILTGTDGKKMSKSLGNCIFVDDKPKDMFGKIMSISDKTMKEWLEVFDVEGIKDVSHPMEKKKMLAKAVVETCHNQLKATRASNAFAKEIQNKEQPSTMPNILADDLIEAVVVLKTTSKTKARRLIADGAVKVDGAVVKDNIDVSPGSVIQVGKRSFAKVIKESSPCS